MDSPRVCIVTAEVEGPFFNGGIGSTNRGLALALRQLGCAVDILYTQVSNGVPVCLRGSFAGHVAEYARQGIRLRAIHTTAGPGDWPLRSWLAMQHLMAERYDIVFFDDIFGTGYYPLLARQTGASGLADTAMVVTTHGALEWVSEQDESAVLNLDGLPVFEMERRSIELADVVKAPSRYILRKYAAYGWALSSKAVVMPNFVSEPKTGNGASAPLKRPVDEIVFFGRLETRKGIWLFLRAIDRIKYRLGGRTVTFLGKSRSTAEQILRQSLGWPCKVRLLTDYNQDQALAYLRGPGRLAVMPSPEDNSPSTVLECLDNGIAFLCSSGSGAEELIDPACHPYTLFEPTVDRLADKILETIDTGGRTARHAFDRDRLLEDFSAFLQHALQFRKRQAPSSVSVSGPAAIIALVPAGQQPEATVSQLHQALAGLETGAILHILSDRPEALEPLLAGLGIRVHAPDQLGEVAADLASCQPRAVALCQVGAIPGSEWFARADVCFAGDILAVTGMALSRAEPDARPRDPWFSPDPAVTVDRHLIGNSPALMTLLQSTNSGFALFRPEVLDLLSALDVVDSRSGRLHPASVIVHDLLALITASGRRFELVPDLPGPTARHHPNGSRASEGPALQLAQRRLGAPDPALWAVNRLAVDAGIDSIRLAEGDALRHALSQRTGFAVKTVTPATSKEQQTTDLARMAAATGQADLAVELLANLHSRAVHLEGGQLADFIRDEAAAIHLVERYRRGAVVPLNLIHDYSITLLSDTELQLHANAVTEPRIALSFPDIDLTGLHAFSARVALPNGQSRPVRLRVDILADGATGHLAIERVLQPGQAVPILVDLPADLRVPCRVVIGLDMADPLAPADHAYLRLANPRFLRRGTGGSE